MNESEHRALREQLGQLALGHLEPATETSLRAHVAGCPGCQAELDDLTPLAAALSRVDPDVLLAVTPPSPSADLGDRILGQVAGERAHQRRRALGWRAALGGAAAAAVVGAFAIGTQVGPSSPTVAAGPPVESITVDTVRPSVVAEAGLVAHTWGTEIKLEASGLRDGGRFRVDFTDSSGRTTSAGTFLGTGAKPVVCSLNAALLRPEVASVQVTDRRGDVVLSADLA